MIYLGRIGVGTLLIELGKIIRMLWAMAPGLVGALCVFSSVQAASLPYRLDARQLTYLLTDSEVNATELFTNCFNGGELQWRLEFRPDKTFAFERWCLYLDLMYEHEQGEGKWDVGSSGVCMASGNPYVLETRTCWRIAVTASGFQRWGNDDKPIADLTVDNEKHPKTFAQVVARLAVGRQGQAAASAPNPGPSSMAGPKAAGEVNTEPAVRVPGLVRRADGKLASRSAIRIAFVSPPLPLPRARKGMGKRVPVPFSAVRLKSYKRLRALGPRFAGPGALGARPETIPGPPGSVRESFNVGALRPDRDAWEKTRKLNTAPAYRRFADDHPTSEFAPLALARLRILNELETARIKVELDFWDQIQSSDDAAVFKAFLDHHPEGEFAPIARSRIAAFEVGARLASRDLERERWDAARASNDPALLRRYLISFPGGRYAAEARARLNRLTRLAYLSEVRFGAYHALVIGNEDYQDFPRLRTAIDDAAAIGDILEQDYGFEVRRLLNARRSDIIDALDILAEEMTPDDNLIIYYAGHGWLDNNVDRGYWLPVDARPNRRSRWLSNATVTDSLHLIKAKHVMVIADSCYSGTLTRGVGLKSPAPYHRYQEMASKRARMALVSGGLEPVSDGRGKHSPFAQALIDVLTENPDIMDGASLFQSLRFRVALETDQTPEYANIRAAGHAGGDFLFVRGALLDN